MPMTEAEGIRASIGCSYGLSNDTLNGGMLPAKKTANIQYPTLNIQS